MKQQVQFLETCDVLDHNRKVVQHFKKGKTYSLDMPSARRWLRRGKVEFVKIAPKQTRKRIPRMHNKGPADKDGDTPAPK